MLASGDILTCSRTGNADLFALAMGGYGLFGILLDLDVEMVPNLDLAPVVTTMATADFLPAFLSAATGGQAAMAYGRLSVDRGHFLERAVLVQFRPVPGNPGSLPPTRPSGDFGALQRMVYRSQVDSEWGKAARWFLETGPGSALMTGRTVSRNTLMNEPVATLAETSPDRTDILHEYFVPPAAFPSFLDLLRHVVPRGRQDLLNVTVRYVAGDPESVLAYAGTPRISSVMSFSQRLTSGEEAAMLRMTQDLLEGVIGLGGAFYLPYRLHARRDQVARAYPGLARFIAEKRARDPGLLFRNTMWATYVGG